MGDEDRDDAPPSPLKEVPIPSPSSPTTLEQAEKFLQDPDVRHQSREKKIEFLKSKGLDDAQITTLLDQQSTEPTSTLRPDSEDQNQKVIAPAQAPATPEPTTPTMRQQAPDTESNRPPIITYPEFLTKPAKPPPLITPSAFLTTVSAFSTAAALIYGTSKFVLEPMVASLTDARADLYATASRNLEDLVDQLEGAVSEIPPSISATARGKSGQDADSDSGSCDDPAELFHRDIGVQTSLPTTPLEPVSGLTGDSESSDAIATQSARLTSLVTSLRSLTTSMNSQSSGYTAAQSTVVGFRNELDHTAAKSRTAGGGGAYGLQYGYGASGSSAWGAATEPNDEIKAAKENIRKLKGMLLGARSFPTSSR